MTSEFTGWRKTSYSGANGGCVEVGWCESTYSSANGGCVEVGSGQVVVGVRDTRQFGLGPVLEFPAAVWSAFIADAKGGRVL